MPSTGFLLGYGGWCHITLNGFTATVPLKSGQYTRSHDVPTANTFAVPNNNRRRSPIQLGTGVYRYSGSISFELTAEMRDFMLDADFFQRDELFSITLCDGDGMVTVADATRVQRFLAEIIEDVPLQAADVNGDGAVTVEDATLIQQYLAEFITEW